MCRHGAPLGPLVARAVGKKRDEVIGPLFFFVGPTFPAEDYAPDPSGHRRKSLNYSTLLLPNFLVAAAAAAAVLLRVALPEYLPPLPRDTVLFDNRVLD